MRSRRQTSRTLHKVSVLQSCDRLFKLDMSGSRHPRLSEQREIYVYIYIILSCQIVGSQKWLKKPSLPKNVLWNVANPFFSNTLTYIYLLSPLSASLQLVSFCWRSLQPIFGSVAYSCGRNRPKRFKGLCEEKKTSSTLALFANRFQESSGRFAHFFWWISVSGCLFFCLKSRDVAEIVDWYWGERCKVGGT